MRKCLTDKGWAEKQATGFTTWLNFTLGGAEKPVDEAGDGDDGDNDHGIVGCGNGSSAGVSSSPLKAMVAMVSCWSGVVRADKSDNIQRKRG